jgi:hypothetical protein
MERAVVMTAPAITPPSQRRVVYAPLSCARRPASREILPATGSMPAARTVRVCERA